MTQPEAGASRRRPRKRPLLTCTLMAALVACTAPQQPATPAADGAVAAGANPILVAISTLQGQGPATDYAGQEVVVEGVVTARLRALGGVFVQDPGGDGDARTSEAVFVAWKDRDSAPAAGTRVRVSGTVVESGTAPHTMTSLQAHRIQELGTAVVPAPQVLQEPADWEALEGMRVRIEAPLTVSGNHALLRFGELEVAFGGRLWQPTERHPPGPAAQGQARQDAARSLLLDDARSGEYPTVAWQLPQPLSATAALRAGSVVHGVEGVLEQRFGRYRIQPTEPFERVQQAPRPPVPQVDGALRLGVFNVLNYFNGDGRDGGFPTARGAETPAQLVRQRAKLVAALVALQADVLALLEIENDGDGPASSVAELAAALDQAQGVRAWRAVPSPAPGADAIRVALLYRSDRVRPAGTPAQLDRGPFAHGSRPPLAMAFALGAGAPVVVAVNHFKSKGGCDEATGANADQHDQQGCWNAARVAAADTLATWLQGDPTGSGSDRVLIVGDLNAYAMEEPLQALARHGYRDVFSRQDGPHYSYVYNGRAGRLDHVLASAAAAPLVAGAAVWHSNADELEAFGYRSRGAAPGLFQPDPWRASDHDPLLIGLQPD